MQMKCLNISPSSLNFSFLYLEELQSWLKAQRNVPSVSQNSLSKWNYSCRTTMVMKLKLIVIE